MNVSQIMSKDTVIIKLNDDLNKVKELFLDNRIHHLLVVEKDQLYGFISDRDFLRAISPRLDTLAERPRDRATLNKKAHQIMTRKVITLSKTVSVDEAVGVFCQHNISSIAIVDANNKPVGIVSWRDILRVINSYRGKLSVDKGKVLSQALPIIARANQSFSLVASCRKVLSSALSRSELFDKILTLLVEKGGYPFVWIASPRNDKDKTVLPLAQAGEASGFLNGATHHWGNDVFGMGPVGMAIKTRETAVLRNIQNHADYKPWRDKAIEHGYHSTASIPCKFGNKLLCVLNAFSTKPSSFANKEIGVLEAVASDIAHAIHGMRMAKDKKTAETRLRSTYLQTVEAMALTIEARDPITTGHQKRVAKLALKIAEKLDWSEERKLGLYLGGLIHDIGKISVPVEILTRDGSLNGAETEVVKSHCQHGKDIVSGIDFPWPIAEIIYQHHERLDGSGYPRGLLDREIIPEARIIAVCDVIEAMSSPRMYRPRRSLQSALTEIKEGSGKLYDTSVVNACIETFNDETFDWNDVELDQKPGYVKIAESESSS